MTIVVTVVTVSVMVEVVLGCATGDDALYVLSRARTHAHTHTHTHIHIRANHSACMHARTHTRTCWA